MEELLTPPSFKRKTDRLFYFQSVAFLILGLLAFFLPHVFELFYAFGHRHETRDSELHLTVRLYGCLLLGNAWVLFAITKSRDPYLRKIILQAYSGVFILASLVMTVTQVVHIADWSVLSWLNILMMYGLSGFCTYFAVFRPISDF